MAQGSKENFLTGIVILGNIVLFTHLIIWCVLVAMYIPAAIFGQSTTSVRVLNDHFWLVSGSDNYFKNILLHLGLLTLGLVLVTSRIEFKDKFYARYLVILGGLLLAWYIFLKYFLHLG